MCEKSQAFCFCARQLGTFEAIGGNKSFEIAQPTKLILSNQAAFTLAKIKMQFNL